MPDRAEFVPPRTRTADFGEVLRRHLPGHEPGSSRTTSRSAAERRGRSRTADGNTTSRLPAQGHYAHKCTVPGHAAAGMKGSSQTLDPTGRSTLSASWRVPIRTKRVGRRGSGAMIRRVGSAVPDEQSLAEGGPACRWRFHGAEPTIWASNSCVRGTSISMPSARTFHGRARVGTAFPAAAPRACPACLPGLCWLA
jgi:hypothetical protein